MARLTIMGSGELAPGMVRVHRTALSEYDEPRLVILDSPFGFQENADQLTTKLVDFFETSLSVSPTVATLRSPDIGTRAARARSAIGNADVLFSGPGSPSYALRVWQESGMADAIEAAALTRSLTFASAAACTLGRWAIPVYEIYKVGQLPFWHDGLDAFRIADLPTVVVPHFDNREGGTHDTSHCYIGERRFRALQAQLPAHVVVGVDEHTAAAFDFVSQTVEVTGRGSLHLIGDEHLILGEGVHPVESLVPAKAAMETEDSPAQGSEVDRLLTDIIAATGPGQAEQAAVALAARAESGAGDPAGLIAPFVDLLLELRATLRAEGKYAAADDIRDRLIDSGVAVHDTPDGVEWSLDQRTERPSS